MSEQKHNPNLESSEETSHERQLACIEVLLRMSAIVEMVKIDFTGRGWINEKHDDTDDSQILFACLSQGQFDHKNHASSSKITWKNADHEHSSVEALEFSKG